MDKLIEKVRVTKLVTNASFLFLFFPNTNFLFYFILLARPPSDIHPEGVRGKTSLQRSAGAVPIQFLRYHKKFCSFKHIRGHLF